jgi:hypothetical protein
MRIDLYTKLVLTVIALMLVAMVCKSVVQPNSVAAEGSLAGVQSVATGPGVWAIDSRSGDVWQYPTRAKTPHGT